MLKVSISKVFSILAILLFFSRIAFSEELPQQRWENYFPSALQEKALLSLQRDATAFGLNLRLAVAGHELQPTNTAAELVSRMGEFQRAISNATTDAVAISVGGRKLVIDRLPIGEGLTGVVYQIREQDAVLKLPQPHAVAFKAMMKESQTMSQVRELEAAGISVAKNLETNQLGVYSIKERAPEMNLTEFLIQNKFIELSEHDNRMAKRISETKLEFLLQNPSLRALAQKVEALLSARRSFDSLKLDLGPDNLHLEARGGQVQRLVLVDLGASSDKTRERLDRVVTFSDYLTFSEEMIGRYLQSGVFATRAAHATHRSAKCVSAFGL